MKNFIKILLSTLTIFLLISFSGIFYLKKGLNEVKNLKINSINLASIKDGKYKGTFDNGRWKNELEITVESSRIKSIKIIKDVKFPKPEVSKKLFKRVIDNQNIKVDAIAGSTVTSKAYLKSIENSLK